MGLKDMKRGEDTEQIRVMDWAAAVLMTRTSTGTGTTSVT